jgi:hypothetical protein
MHYSCFTILVALIACFGVYPIDGFSLSTKTIHLQRQRTPGNSSPLLFHIGNTRQQTFFRSSSDDTDDLAKSTETPAEASEPSTVPSQKSWGVTKTILLTVPLFFKFLVVLVIKFMTDLVVFPLLFSYRMCRRAKRKVLGVFRKTKKDTKLPNGETRP